VEQMCHFNEYQQWQSEAQEVTVPRDEWYCEEGWGEEDATGTFQEGRYHSESLCDPGCNSVLEIWYEESKEHCWPSITEEDGTDYVWNVADDVPIRQGQRALSDQLAEDLREHISLQLETSEAKSFEHIDKWADDALQHAPRGVGESETYNAHRDEILECKEKKIQIQLALWEEDAPGWAVWMDEQMQVVLQNVEAQVVFYDE
jgi:hypothetical protein